MTVLLLIVFCAAALITATACRALRPLLQRYALARPNARSSHAVPTPQGGGIAILLAMVLIVAILAFTQIQPHTRETLRLMGAALILGLVGGWDDLRPLPASLRLMLQGLAVAGVVLALPPLGLLPGLPVWCERALVVLAGLWFVNLTNFMDGLDWLTVAGFVPMTGFIAVVGITGSGMVSTIGAMPALFAAILCGALIGFAPLNRPVARLFLGDVGSLPIGLIGAYLLYHVAGSAGLTPALILPLYHVTDATLTLFRRFLRRERVWEAHRSHAYQVATTHGFSVMAVSGHVFGLNIILCALAFAAITFKALPVQLACFAVALALVLGLIRYFTRPRVGTP
jgi:UDP-N-acetylmuramyl pentapeptide phosphotransferase/UDP-N-acetylglucosamine-1-phosphate transferase